jgi:uracil-DNA glycosylase family 4
MPKKAVNDSIIPQIPDYCRECGLHSMADSWCLQEELDSRKLKELEGAPLVMIVAPPPRKQDDALGRIVTGPSGDFLRQFMDCLECHWVLVTATRCYAGRNDSTGAENSPSDAQIKVCADNVLRASIEHHKPDVVVCLGHPALVATLGDECPSSISKALKTTMKPESLGGNIWVLAAYDPSNHISGRMDLRDEYFRLFTKAEELALRHNVVDAPFSFDSTDSVEDALLKLDAYAACDKVYFDVEVSQSDNDPEKKTMWHPGSRLLSCSLTFPSPAPAGSPHSLDYGTLVLYGDALDASVVRKAISGRCAVAHNLKYDANALYRFLGVDVFTEAGSFHDTLLDFYLRDQSKMGNSLKQLAEDMFGAPRWDAPIWDCIDAKNAELRKLGAEANRANNKTIRSIRKLVSLLPEGKKKARWVKVLEEGPSEIRDGYSYLTIPLHPFNGKFPPFLPVPLQNADFGDVPLEDLLPYNARDTYWDARLGEEIIPRFPQKERADPEAVAFMLRNTHALARVERKGLPFNRERMKALEVATKRKIEQITALLLRQKEVLDALKLVCENRKTPYTGPITPDLLNVKSFIFYEALIKTTRAPIPPLTESKRFSSSKDTLKWLAGIDPKVPEDLKTRRHRIFEYFYALRQARDLLSKFIESYSSYLVDDDEGMPRIHTDFRLTKVEGVGRGSGADDLTGGAGSGRLSSSAPNLQNISGNVVVKSCLVAPAGKLFLECDFSTGEPVILAHLADIKEWKKVFEERIDLYKYISTKIPFLNCPTLESVTPEVRKEIKVETLAIMYDEQPVSFARRTGMPENQALEFFKQFAEAFPEIDVWKKDIKGRVAKGEIITTLFGKKKSFPLKGDSKYDSGILRQAINFPVQCSLSDITQWKLYEILQWIESWGLEDAIYPNNTVHDSIWFEVQQKGGLEHVQAVAEIMQDMTTLPFKLDIPLRISFKIGRDFGHMEEYKTFEELADAWERA